MLYYTCCLRFTSCILAVLTWYDLWYRLLRHYVFSWFLSWYFQDLNGHVSGHGNKCFKWKECKLTDLTHSVDGLNSVGNQNKHDWHSVEDTGRIGCHKELDCDPFT